MSWPRVSLSPQQAWCLARSNDMHRRQFMAAAAGGIVAGRDSAAAFPVRARPARRKQRMRRHGSPRDVSLPSRFGKIAYVERGERTRPPCSCTASRSAAFSGAARSIASPTIGAAWRPISWDSDSRRSRRSRAARRMRRSRCSRRCSTRFRSRQVDLIANDSGGAVAQLFVLRYPQRVRTMLLTNCDVEPDSPPPALKPVLDAVTRGQVRR